MSQAEFKTGIKILEEHIKSCANSVFAAMDRFTFRMLINALKSSDPEAIKGTINQLVKEKRPLAIPPLYLVSVAHSSAQARKYALEGLKTLVPENKIEEIVKGKNIEGAVQALIKEFGHYRS